MERRYTRQELIRLRDLHGYAIEREPGTWEVLTMDPNTGATVLLLVPEESPEDCKACGGKQIYHVMTDAIFCETCNDWTF